MSTQFDTPILDLDRTDELPVLDVVAYEASLAANDKSLSRTDTWAVEGLRALDEPDEEARGAVPSSSVAKAGVQSEALTTNVERILRRIAELEAEVVATHETNASLRKDCEVLRAEQVQANLRIVALQADNARLGKDRAKSDEIAQHREQQLRERAESIAALEKSLGNEKDIAAHLSRQLAVKLMDCEQAASTIELRDRAINDHIRDAADLNQRLQREIAASADLTARLAAAERSLHESHAQLLEHDEVIVGKDAQLMEAHAQIQSLTGERDAFRSASSQLDARTADLEQRNAEVAQLMTQLRAARDECATTDVQLNNARARAKNLTEQIFSRDNQIAALEAELAVHTEALATIQRDVSRIGRRADAEFNEVEHMLEPVGQEGPTFYLTSEVLTVGRTSDNDICIPSKLVSRCHARLLVGPTGVIIEDVNSMNGCYVNGEHVRQYLLQDGDVLELGDMRYRLRTRELRSGAGIAARYLSARRADSPQGSAR